jgi:hypothetical protein
VLLSPEEYDRLRGLNVAEFQSFCERVAGRAAARGMTQEKLWAILADDAA